MGKLEHLLAAGALASFLVGLGEIKYFELKKTKEPAAVVEFYGNKKRISELEQSLTPPHINVPSERWDLSNPENIKYFTSLQQELSSLIKKNEKLSRQPDVSAVILNNEKYERYTRYGDAAIIVGG